MLDYLQLKGVGLVSLSVKFLVRLMPAAQRISLLKRSVRISFVVSKIFTKIFFVWFYVSVWSMNSEGYSGVCCVYVCAREK